MMMAIVAILFLQLLVFQQSDCKEICRSEACKEEASNMEEAMDKTIEPCDDFYEFACRGWIKKNPIPHNEVRWTTVQIITETVKTNIHKIIDSSDTTDDGRPIKLARALYRSCMNLEALEKTGMEPLRNALRKIGFSLTPPTDDEAKKYDLGKIAGLAYRYFGMNIFHKLGIQESTLNDTTHVLRIQEPDFPLENLEMALQNSEMDKLKDEMRSYMNDMLKLTGVGNEGNSYVTEYLNFLTDLSMMKVHGRDRTIHAAINSYQQAIDPEAVKWNWTTFLNSVFNETDVIFDSKSDQLYSELVYLSGFKKVLDKTPIETLVRAVYFHTFLTIAAEDTYAGDELNRKFKKKIYRAGVFNPKWMECTELVMKHFNFAVTAAYVEKYFNPEQKKKAMEMWTDVRESFDDILNEIDWMDAPTKSKAHKKLHAMGSHIAYPDWITNSTELDQYYAEHKVDEGKLYESKALAIEIEMKRKLNKWKRKTDKSEWIGDTTDVNAFHSGTINSVVIPAGILHVPFFGSGIDAINYGAFGAMLGHEISHGFDSYGRLFDENGIFGNWWSKDTFDHFLNKVKCMIKQYSGFEVTQLDDGEKVNGVITQGENIADNGGLREAFRAFQKLKQRNKEQPGLPGLLQYTDEQLFFIGYAQAWCANESDTYLRMQLQSVHAPNRYRVMGTLQNNAEFAEAYKCPLGSRMNPKNKCIVW